jgi:hypothetical protein
MSRYLPGIWGHVPWPAAAFATDPRLAARQVRGRHRILVIHGPLTLRALAWYRGDWVAGGRRPAQAPRQAFDGGSGEAPADRPG